MTRLDLSKKQNLKMMNVLGTSFKRKLTSKNCEKFGGESPQREADLENL